MCVCLRTNGYKHTKIYEVFVPFDDIHFVLRMRDAFWRKKFFVWKFSIQTTWFPVSLFTTIVLLCSVIVFIFFLLLLLFCNLHTYINTQTGYFFVKMRKIKEVTCTSQFWKFFVYLLRDVLLFNRITRKTLLLFMHNFYYYINSFNYFHVFLVTA